MIKIYSYLFILILVINLFLPANEFGFVGYSWVNIGDDIQSIAAKQFLPKDSISIDRESLPTFQHSTKVHTIINCWLARRIKKLPPFDYPPTPPYNWPPSPSIDPLLISVHFCQHFAPYAVSGKNKEYLIKHGPIGARDLSTLQLLQKHKIPSYFSACLTLTLDNPYKERDDIIYAVDIDEECLEFIRAHTKYKIETLTHKVSNEMKGIDRLNYAESLLEKYRKAHCVITSRLHASMPCLAFETPVLLINEAKDQNRFDGLRELVRNCSKKDLLQGEVDFDFDHPEENPQLYLPYRENLIRIVTEWVQKKLKEI